jgi:hypothetical protein
MLESIQDAIDSHHGASVLCKRIPGFWDYFRERPDRRSRLKQAGYDYTTSTGRGWIVFRTELDIYKPNLRKPKESVTIPVPKHVAEAEARKAISRQFR